MDWTIAGKTYIRLGGRPLRVLPRAVRRNQEHSVQRRVQKPQLRRVRLFFHLSSASIPITSQITRTLLHTSVVVTDENTSLFHVSFAALTSASNEFDSGISFSLNSHAFAVEMNEIPILDSTTSSSPAVELNESSAPSLFLPDTLVAFPNDSNVSPETAVPANVRACDGVLSTVPQK